ncbi:MAG: hypothetical protein AAFY20_10620 [Cyanobacteria bacterium J06639_14]
MTKDYQDSQVRVQIKRVRQLNDVDSTSSADFYSTVRVENYLTHRFETVDNVSDLRPSDWILSKVVDGGNSLVPITIQLFDSDRPWSQDDHIDIDPRAEHRNLNLFLNLSTQKVLNNSGQLLGSVGEDITVQGIQGHSAAITFSIDSFGTDIKEGYHFLSQNTLGVEKEADSYSRFGESVAVGDFNNDGYSDLLVGVYEGPGAGGIHVFNGSGDGLDIVNDQYWDQNSPGIAPDPSTADDPYQFFGGTLATGDFDGDSFDDVASGSKLLGAIADEDVNVLYGSSVGLTSLRNQRWTQNNLNKIGPAGDDTELGDWFGTALATGDFNQDGFDDLVVGAPGEAIGSQDNAGAVNIIYGSEVGLSTFRTRSDQFFHQSSGIAAAETNDYFGKSVATGDFNGDGFDELVVGAPGEDFNTIVDGGAVHVLSGTANGLTTVGHRFLVQGPGSGLAGSINSNDRFGESLATGDLNNDGFDDLVIGAPGEDNDKGVVHILYGSANGLVANTHLVYERPALGVREVGDRFGETLVIEDWNNDGFDDLLVGSPNNIAGVGTVHILNGSASGVYVYDAELLSQSSQDFPDVPGLDEVGDLFGTSLALGDFNSNGSLSLAVGAPGEAIGALTSAGAVNIVSSDNILTGNSQQNMLIGSNKRDTIDAGAGDDTLQGNEDRDTLIGGPGNDLVDGGANIDTVRYISSTSGITVNLQNGTAADGFGSTDTLISIEQVVGSDFNDVIVGSEEDEIFFGGAGDDQIYAAGGDDELYGEAGKDLLNGGTGADYMEGGTENDIYYVDNVGDQVIEAAAGGSDKVRTSLDNYVLGDHVEALELEGNAVTGYGNGLNNFLGGQQHADVAERLFGRAGNDNVYGNGGDDELYGEAGRDVLNGGTGADIMDGGTEDDIYYVDNVGDQVIEAANGGTDKVRTSLDGYVLADHVEALELLDNAITGYGNSQNNALRGNDKTDAAERLFGGEGNDNIHSYDGNDELYGEDGNDNLYGGDDNDRLYGQKGNDIAEGNDGDDWIYGGQGDDTLRGGNDDDFLYGEAGNDNLQGNDGRDHLKGGIGADTMKGGRGNDVMFVDDAGDQAIEYAGEGYDTVRTALNDYVLANHIERLQLIEGADNGHGNELDNEVYGHVGLNEADTLFGGTGDDTIHGWGGNDSLFGEEDNDTLYGVDTRFNNPGENEIDILTGGSGVDTFALGYQANDQVFYAYGGDSDYAQITDFNDDKIQIKGSFEDYELRIGAGGPVGANDTGIYFTQSGANDLIAVVQNVTTLASSDFNELGWN